MKNHPQINILYQLLLNETQPFRKVHRMIDLFESIIKTHTVLIMAEYVRHNKLSDEAKGLLSQGLRTPSLGTWQLFSRVLFEELEKAQFAWSLPVFAKEFADLDKALNNEKTNVIAFRNGYAHGANATVLQGLHYATYGGALIHGHTHNLASIALTKHGGGNAFSAGCLCLKDQMAYATHRLAHSRWGSGFVAGWVDGDNYKAWLVHKVGDRWVWTSQLTFWKPE